MSVEWPAGSVGDGEAFGVDCSALPDLNMGVEQTGYATLGEAILRRLMTPRGDPGGLFYDSDYGLDLRQWINESGRYEEVMPELASLVAQECEKDPRVVSATVEVFQMDQRNGRISIRCTTAEGLIAYFLTWAEPLGTLQIRQAEAVVQR